MDAIRTYDVPPTDGRRLTEAKRTEHANGVVVTVEPLANGLERWTYDYTNDKHRL